MPLLNTTFWRAEGGLLHDYETQFIHSCIPFPHLKETITLLQEQDYVLGIITNGRATFQSLSIQGLGIDRYFDTILISETEQVKKPQPEIFHRALLRLGVTAEESVYIGDNPEADIMGAKNAGLKTIWQRNQFWDEPKEADAVIDGLEEILLILRLWQEWLFKTSFKKSELCKKRIIPCFPRTERDKLKI